MRDRFLAPKDLREAVDGPGIDRQQSRLLHGLRHEECGNMLPPTADMIRITSVDSGPNCARVRYRLANNMPSAHRESGRQTHDDKAGNVPHEINLENEPGPHEHQHELREGQQNAVDQLAGQQPAHRDVRASRRSSVPLSASSSSEHSRRWR